MSKDREENVTKLYEYVRGVGAFLAITTFLILLIADVVIPDMSFSETHIQYLLLLIGALLGIDFLMGQVFRNRLDRSQHASGDYTLIRKPERQDREQADDNGDDS